MAVPSDFTAALERARTLMRRRPDVWVQDDATATARWSGGTRIACTHANGFEVLTDMPEQLGGSGGKVSPGWMFRSGIAACAATAISMTAAAEGIELTSLEIQVKSRSDPRGLLGVDEPDGTTVYPGPREMVLAVKIAARGISPEDLKAFVERSNLRAPMSATVRNAIATKLEIEAETA